MRATHAGHFEEQRWRSHLECDQRRNHSARRQRYRCVPGVGRPYVPDPSQYADQNPNLKNFKFPPQTGIQLVMGLVNPVNYRTPGMVSQSEIMLSLK
jgi:hypothetical protein